jgi:hypothetical protein
MWIPLSGSAMRSSTPSYGCWMWRPPYCAARPVRAGCTPGARPVPDVQALLPASSGAPAPIPQPGPVEDTALTARVLPDLLRGALVSHGRVRRDGLTMLAAVLLSLALDRLSMASGDLQPPVGADLARSPGGARAHHGAVGRCRRHLGQDPPVGGARRPGFPVTGVWREAARATAYVVIWLPVALLWLVVVVGAAAVSVGASVVLVGLPLWLLTFALARVGASAERSLPGRLVGVPTDAPARRPPGRAPLARLRARFADGQSWREVGYPVLALPLAALSFVAVLLLAFVAGQTLFYPFRALTPHWTRLIPGLRPVDAKRLFVFRGRDPWQGGRGGPAGEIEGGPGNAFQQALTSFVPDRPSPDPSAHSQGR